MTCSFEEISFRALFDVAADAMLIVDSEGHIVLSNPSVQQLLKYPSEKLNGLSVEALIPQHYRENHRRHRNEFLQEPIKRAMGSGREISALTRDGLELPVDISLSPIMDGDGMHFTLVTINSIAERKQVQHELHIAEERLRLAAEAAHFGTFDADLTTNTLYWSPELREIVGLPPGSRTPALGEEFTYLHPDEVERVRVLLRSAYGPEGNGEVEDEQRIVRPDGSVRWLLVKGKAQFTGKGEMRRAVRATGFVLDITERKNAENALKASEVLFKTIVDSSPIPIAISRLSDGIFIETNEAFLNMYGYSREEVIGHTSLELDLWNDREQRKKMYELISGFGYTVGLDMIFTKKSGEVGFGIISAAKITLFNEPHVIGFLQDMTERKKLGIEILERQREMNALQKLQVAAQTASAFAHELNQPLLAIASYSEAALILLKAEKPNLDKVRKAIEGSELQAHRAGQSIRELLEFLSTKEFTTEVLDLNKEILDALDTTRAEHKLQFLFMLQMEGNFPLIRANRTHVQKVLLNLLHNGIDAMQEITTPHASITVIVRTRPDQTAAQVTILDNGPGIKKEHFHRLFEPFFTTKAEGIGMGLAVSRSLIEANGGQLWVDPQEGPGATFHLTLPFAP
jgi:PAS domain S-box-containing protein